MISFSRILFHNIFFPPFLVSRPGILRGHPAAAVHNFFIPWTETMVRTEVFLHDPPSMDELPTSQVPGFFGRCGAGGSWLPSGKLT